MLLLLFIDLLVCWYVPCTAGCVYVLFIQVLFMTTINAINESYMLLTVLLKAKSAAVLTLSLTYHSLSKVL